MAEAWMVRKGEQERFIDNIVKSFRDAVEPDDEHEKIKSLLMSILKNELHIAAPEIDHQMRNFARAKEEYEALKWRFSEKLLQVITLNAEQNLARYETMFPWIIFRASSGMTKVRDE